MLARSSAMTPARVVLPVWRGPRRATAGNWSSRARTSCSLWRAINLVYRVWYSINARIPMEARLTQPREISLAWHDCRDRAEVDCTGPVRSFRGSKRPTDGQSTMSFLTRLPRTCLARVPRRSRTGLHRWSARRAPSRIIRPVRCSSRRSATRCPRDGHGDRLHGAHRAVHHGARRRRPRPRRRAGEAWDADGGPDHPRPQPLNSDATIDSRCLNCSNQAVRLGCPARQSIVSLKRKSR